MEFRQSGIPRTKWIKVNVPAHETKNVASSSGTRELKNSLDTIKWSDNLFVGNNFDHNKDEELGGRRSRLYRGTNAPKLTEFRQSYALRGLSRATNYEVCFFV